MRHPNPSTTSSSSVMNEINSIRLRSLANGLTLFRAIAGVPLMVALSFEQMSFAWCLILIASITDIADGQIARKAGGGSSWGARLDPLADKILLNSPLIWLASTGFLPVWPVWLLITRDLAVSLWRTSTDNGGPAKLGGKIKTSLLFLSVLLMIWPDKWIGTYNVLILHNIGLFVFWASLFISILSAVGYLNIKSIFHHY